MSDAIEFYLYRLEKRLRQTSMPFGVRRVVAECRSHLEESAEALGHDEAVRSFGPVDELAEMFRVSLGHRHARAAAWLVPACNAVLFAMAGLSFPEAKSIAAVGLCASLPALLALPVLRRLTRGAQLAVGAAMFLGCCMPTAAAGIIDYSLSGHWALMVLGQVAASVALFAGISGGVFLVTPRSGPLAVSQR